MIDKMHMALKIDSGEIVVKGHKLSVTELMHSGS
jgi:hypothetical protein